MVSWSVSAIAVNPAAPGRANDVAWLSRAIGRRRMRVQIDEVMLRRARQRCRSRRVVGLGRRVARLRRTRRAAQARRRSARRANARASGCRPANSASRALRASRSAAATNRSANSSRSYCVTRPEGNTRHGRPVDGQRACRHLSSAPLRRRRASGSSTARAPRRAPAPVCRRSGRLEELEERARQRRLLEHPVAAVGLARSAPACDSSALAELARGPAA